MGCWYDLVGWVVSWYTGMSMSLVRFGGSIIVFGRSGIPPFLLSPGSTIPNSYPKSYLKYMRPVSGSTCFVPKESLIQTKCSIEESV